MTYFLGEHWADRECASRSAVLERARHVGAAYQQVSSDGGRSWRVLLRTGRYGAAVGGGWFSTRAQAAAFCRIASQFVGVQDG